MAINYDTTRPIYEQIIDFILKKLASGEYSAGSKLPSQREMAKLLSVNPNTVQRAYREMEIKDLVETRRGLGTFVTESEDKIEEVRIEMGEEIIENFIEELRALGFTKAEIDKMLADKFAEFKGGKSNGA
ncbi:GntR family transcriptional regulator [Halanaerobiaceae bacterium Z-7014]|uniref:GntR family transcriptional regulator n=1 Tax=Halonatronomonas betaini TaxID=2778430 RepID=A0A931F8W1_9FIRM|nr:GntR family transcriptional regulator [Halonatronomonas betaini]MBF8435779.1 GntR family transcriptional regulator [Halonatronomonas betaini]